jgi:3-methyladenine DNA glycosylase Tag
MTRAVFQGGISWNVVNAKWDGIQRAFHGFDAERVADMTEPELDAIAANPDVIRNRRKIEATVSNAARLLELEDQYGDVGAFLDGLPDYAAKVKALRANFKFLGETGCYYFLYVVGQEVPPHDEWRRSLEK